jgi:hypothetical protein
VTELIAEIEALGLVWRVSSVGAMAAGTRAEAMVRGPRRREWHFGYGDTVEEALADVLKKWRERPE